MEKYRNGLSESGLQFIKDYMIRSNALRFETNGSLVGMLNTMARFGLPDDYVKRDEEIIKNINVDEAKTIIDKYIVPDRMYYVVAGDAATQMQPLEKLGFGKPILVKQ